MKTEYFGSCHCDWNWQAGRQRTGVYFSAKLDVEDGRNGICNCSRCQRIGFLHHHVTEGEFEILGGKALLETYTFNTHGAQHLFCRRCGVQAFYRSRSDPTKWDINLRCIDGLDIYALKYWLIDGQNWQASQDARRRHEADGTTPTLYSLLGARVDGGVFWQSSHVRHEPPPSHASTTPDGAD